MEKRQGPFKEERVGNELNYNRRLVLMEPHLSRLRKYCGRKVKIIVIEDSYENEGGPDDDDIHSTSRIEAAGILDLVEETSVRLRVKSARKIYEPGTIFQEIRPMSDTELTIPYCENYCRYKNYANKSRLASLFVGITDVLAVI